MRDSNKSFSEWLEIMHLVLNDKKSLSIKSILRNSRQSRYETVYHMVRKIQLELGKINKQETTEFFVNFKLSSYKVRMNYQTSIGRKNDKIRLSINPLVENILNEVKLRMVSKSNYPYPKLIKNRPDVKCKTQGVNSKEITFNWKQKIKNNLIKIIKGMHHKISDFHLQACLDEYCFKYNHRRDHKPKILIFMEKCSSLWKESG